MALRSKFAVLFSVARSLERQAGKRSTALGGSSLQQKVLCKLMTDAFERIFHCATLVALCVICFELLLITVLFVADLVIKVEERDKAG